MQTTPMQTTLVDSHCHLDMLPPPEAEGGMDAYMRTARDNDVGHMLCVSVNMEDWPAMMDIVRRYENVYASVGVHPNHNQGGEAGIEPGIEELVTLAQDNKVIAIGETGLDYFRSEGELEWQRERFRRHIEASKQSGKPLIIHTREAREDTLQLMREEKAGDAGGVMHCFAEDWETAKAALDMGFYISFSGIVTFKNAQSLKEVARLVPLDMMLVETDAPYLAPVPHRGKPNQPAYVRHVAEHIAELRGDSYTHIASVTTENFFRLFSGAQVD